MDMIETLDKWLADPHRLPEFTCEFDEVKLVFAIGNFTVGDKVYEPALIWRSMVGSHDMLVKDLQEWMLNQTTFKALVVENAEDGTFLEDHLFYKGWMNYEETSTWFLTEEEA